MQEPDPQKPISFYEAMEQWRLTFFGPPPPPPKWYSYEGFSKWAGGALLGIVRAAHDVFLRYFVFWVVVWLVVLLVALIFAR